MDPKKGIELAGKLGIPSKLVAIAEIAVPLVLALAAIVVAFVVARRKKKSAPPSVEVSGAPRSTPGALTPGQLRRAWLRFFSSLPAVYRRSILNFEHYIVLGAPSAGKSRLIDVYSDWQRQAKQFLNSQSFDADLQVYLGSWAVVTELPARILGDYGESCHRALGRLWRPLYRRRSPTVLVVVDAARAREATVDEVTDLAERMRGKINLLSKIRGRPIEVRVVLTHLDELEGFRDFAAFCGAQGIALRMPIDTRQDQPAPSAQIEAWLTTTRGHLPRALVSLPTASFRRVVDFMRSAPELAAPVGRFYEALFAREALSSSPISGGVYLADATPGLPNPLRDAAETGPGPDPRIRHTVLVGALVGTVLMYLTLAFFEQRSVSRRAIAAIRDYEPSAVGSEAESAHRYAIAEFTARRHRLLAYPDFFEAPRQKVREQLSRQIRDELLIPRLRLVAKNGAVNLDSPSLPWRRSLYYLALIHGDRADRMHILDSKWLGVWSQMTELPSDLVRDYLQSTDVAFRQAVSFDLSSSAFDARDDVAHWAAYLRDLTAKMETDSVKPAELEELQARAGELLESFDRFEHDEKTLSILTDLDSAANYTPSTGPGASRAELRAAYAPKYEGLLGKTTTSDVYAQREDLKAILRAVRASSIAATDVPLLATLDDRLAALSQAPGEPGEPGPQARVIKVKLGQQEFGFDEKKWSELLENGRAAELVSLFLRSRAGAGSIFFDPGIDTQLRPIAWNPSNDGTSMFLGKAEIEPRYTRAAFDRYVQAPVTKIAATLDKVGVPEDLVAALAELVKDQVRAYAAEYKSQVVRYFRSFGMRARSTQELRVVLAQMVADSSPFADFLATVDRQVGVSTSHAWLAPMDEALSELATLHRLVDSSNGAPEIGKYKEILRQLLNDLGPADGLAMVQPATLVSSPESPQTLESGLSPAGVLTLKSIRGEKGSYPAMVYAWIAGVRLRDAQQRPFALPIEQLVALGLEEIERELARDWDREVLAGLARVVEKFPFDPAAKEEVRPKELEALFDPQKGSFVDAFRRYLEPVSDFGDGRPFGELPALRGKIELPRNMYAVVNAAAAVSSRLYDAKSRPKALDVRIGTVPFDHGTDPSAALTLSYMTIGETSIFNFNQKPSVTTVHFDWTREQACQVGVQLTDLDTKDNKLPTPFAVPPSYFSLFRLLADANEAKPVTTEPGTTVHSWTPGAEKNGVRVRFATYGDALDVFGALAQQVKWARGAVAGGGGE